MRAGKLAVGIACDLAMVLILTAIVVAILDTLAAIAAEQERQATQLGTALQILARAAEAEAERRTVVPIDLSDVPEAALWETLEARAEADKQTA